MGGVDPELLHRLPEWGMFLCVLAYLIIRGVKEILAKKHEAEAKREATKQAAEAAREQRELVREYRQGRSKDKDGDEVTGQHSLQYLLERDRDREGQEMLHAARDNAATNERLSTAIAQQGQLMERLVDMTAHTHVMLEREVEVHDRLVSHMLNLAKIVERLQKADSDRPQPYRPPHLKAEGT